MDQAAIIQNDMKVVDTHFPDCRKIDEAVFSLSSSSGARLWASYEGSLSFFLYICIPEETRF